MSGTIYVLDGYFVFNKGVLLKCWPSNSLSCITLSILVERNRRNGIIVPGKTIQLAEKKFQVSNRMIYTLYSFVCLIYLKIPERKYHSAHQFFPL